MSTPIARLSFIIVLLSVGIIISLLFREYIMSSILVIIFIVLLIIWYQKLGENLVIYFLKNNSFQIKIEVLQAKLSKNAIGAIERLRKKGIVKVEGGVVYLLKKDVKIPFKRT